MCGLRESLIGVSSRGWGCAAALQCADENWLGMLHSMCCRCMVCSRAMVRSAYGRLFGGDIGKWCE